MKKLIKNNGTYKTFSSLCNNNLISSENKNLSTFPLPAKLHSWFITGFLDGESYFHIQTLKPSLAKKTSVVKVRFGINLHKKDRALLELIQMTLGA